MSKSSIFIAPNLAIAGLAFVLAACGQTATTDTAVTDTPQTTNPAPLAIPVATPDFVQQAAISDMYEIQASRLANRRAQNREIKTFAQQMITDHTATTTQLTGLVRGLSGVNLPTALDQKHQDLIAALTNASAADFDQVYVDQQTEAHENALDLLQRYGQTGDNDALRGFATETAPKVQHHLDMVRALDHSGADEPTTTTHP